MPRRQENVTGHPKRRRIAHPAHDISFRELSTEAVETLIFVFLQKIGHADLDDLDWVLSGHFSIPGYIAGFDDLDPGVAVSIPFDGSPSGGDIVASLASIAAALGGLTVVASGVATLVAGQATVAAPLLGASDRIFLCAQDVNCLGQLRVTNQIVATSFEINSTGFTDDGVVAWIQFAP